MRERKIFRPLIYRDWLPIFQTMSEHDRSELLLAIASFPDYEPEGVALWPFFREQLRKQRALYQEKCDKNQRIADERERRRAEGSERTRTCTNVDDGTRTCTNVHECTPNLEPRTYNLEPKNLEPKKETEKETAPAPSAQDAPVSQPSAGKKAKRSSLCKPKEVPEALWNDWLSLRKQKRLPLTAQALAIVQAEATKAGKPLAEAIEICLQNSWAGFKASWLENQSRGDSSSSSVFKAVPRRTEEDEDIDFGFENFRVAK